MNFIKIALYSTIITATAQVWAKDIELKQTYNNIAAKIAEISYKNIEFNAALKIINEESAKSNICSKMYSSLENCPQDASLKKEDTSLYLEFLEFLSVCRKA